MGEQARYLIIVAREEREVYEYLLERFREDAKVEVLLDRRRNGQRQLNGQHEPEQRRVSGEGGRGSAGIVLIRKRQTGPPG